MAMSEAAKMFDQHDSQGNVNQGTKQDAVNAAAGMATKLLANATGNVGSGGSGIAGLLLNAAGGQGGGNPIMGILGKLSQ
jgi:hypothetical protein